MAYTKENRPGAAGPPGGETDTGIVPAEAKPSRSRDILSRLQAAHLESDARWGEAARLMADLAECWGELVDAQGRKVEHLAAYVAKTLGVTRRRVYQLRDAGRVLRLIDGVNHGSQSIDPSSLSERVVRPLTRLQGVQDVAGAWRDAVGLAAQEKPHAREIRVLGRHTAKAVRRYLPPEPDDAMSLARARPSVKRFAGRFRHLPAHERRQLLFDFEAGLEVAPDSPRDRSDRSSSSKSALFHDDAGPAGQVGRQDLDKTLRAELPDGADRDQIIRFLREHLGIDRGRARKQAADRLMTPELARSVASLDKGQQIDNRGGYFAGLVDDALADAQEQHRRQLDEQAEADRHALEDADRAIDELPDAELQPIIDSHDIMRGMDLDSIRRDPAFRPELAKLVCQRLQEVTTS